MKKAPASAKASLFPDAGAFLRLRLYLDSVHWTKLHRSGVPPAWYQIFFTMAVMIIFTSGTSFVQVNDTPTLSRFFSTVNLPNGGQALDPPPALCKD